MIEIICFVYTRAFVGLVPCNDPRLRQASLLDEEAGVKSRDVSLAREKAQQVKCLPHKQEGLSSSLQHLYKKPKSAVNNPRAGRRKQEATWGLLAGKSSLIGMPQANEEPSLRK